MKKNNGNYMMANDITRLQHVVQRALLENFAVDGKLIAYNLQSEKWSTPGPKSVCAETFFYELPGMPINHLEAGLIGDVEQGGFGAISHVVSNRPKLISATVNRNLKNYALLQTLRSPYARSLLAEQREFFTVMWHEMGFSDFKLPAARYHHAKQILSISYFRDLLKYHDAFFAVDPQSRFIISDNCGIKNNRFFVSEDFIANGYASVGMEIILPVSPSLCLVLHDKRLLHRLRQALAEPGETIELEGTEATLTMDRHRASEYFETFIRQPAYINASPEWVNQVNAKQIRFAKRWVFVPSENQKAEVVKAVEDNPVLKVMPQIDLHHAMKNEIVRITSTAFREIEPQLDDNNIHTYFAKEYDKAYVRILAKHENSQAKFYYSLRTAAESHERDSEPTLDDLQPRPH